MEAIECIKTRRSIRKFTDEPVSRETLEQIVKIASYSPSWKNSQAVRYVAVEDPALKAAIAEKCVLNFTSNAAIIKACPVLIVVTIVHGRSGYERSGEPTTSKGDRWEVFDAGIATQTLSLAAHNTGLGTVIMGIFDEDKVSETLALPDGQIPAALVALGHPAISPSAPPRKSVEDLLSYR